MDRVVADAIDAYHGSLSPERAVECSEWLTERLRQDQLEFGGRPLCTVLRPRFLSPAQHRRLRDGCAAVLRAFDTALGAAFADPAVMRQFALPDWEEALVREDRSPYAASPTSRLDSFFDERTGALRFAEYNAETPAGIAYGDALAEYFLAFPPMAELGRRFEIRALPARQSVLAALLDAHHRWLGRWETPSIAIVDWQDVPTQSEFRLFRAYFNRMGVPCTIVDPGEMEYRNGALWANGERVSIIYKRVLISELVTRCGLMHPLVRAVRDGAVCMVNPFRCKVLHKKASLAVLSDERNEALFDHASRQAIAAHIPWTRRVEERWTMYEGKRVDLLPFAAARRERLVLKPNDDYGGAGIVLGWTVDAVTWERALGAALEAPFVLQERIMLPSETFPAVVDGQLIYADRIVDTAPFAFDGRYVDGYLSRISTGALVNVTAGTGSTVPTFIVEPR